MNLSDWRGSSEHAKQLSRDAVQARSSATPTLAEAVAARAKARELPDCICGHPRAEHVDYEFECCDLGECGCEDYRPDPDQAALAACADLAAYVQTVLDDDDFRLYLMAMYERAGRNNFRRPQWAQCSKSGYRT